MATLRQSKQVVANKATPAPVDGVAVVAIIGDFVVPAGLVLNDVIEMGAIPADCVPVDLVVAFEDCDTNGTPTIKFDAGIISGTFGQADNTRTCGAEFLSADTTAQAGGVARMNVKAGGLVTPTTADRGWGLKVQTGAATVGTGAKIRAVLTVATRTVTM